MTEFLLRNSTFLVRHSAVQKRVSENAHPSPVHRDYSRHCGVYERLKALGFSSLSTAKGFA
jgi:hypothetical protein